MTPAAIYVVANVAVSGLGFLRNIYFMQSMSRGDLGQVAMLQSIVVVVGFLQLGLINGAYRLYASADADYGARINSIVMTSLFGICMLMLPTVSLLQYFAGFKIDNVEGYTLLMGCIIGGATLASTWLNNALIAKSRLGMFSAINLCAAVASLLVVLVPNAVGIRMAFIALLLQPLAVLVFTLALHKPSRPTISVSLPLIKEIVALGFAPLCAGILALTNFQIERWFIVSYLGAEAMGTYYLTIVYSTVFTLIPVSLLNLFYPRTVNAYELKDMAKFTRLSRTHLMLLLAYLGVTAGVTLLALPLVLESLLKSYIGHQDLVFLSLPGLIAYSLFDNVALVLQSAKKMLNIFLFPMLALLINFTTLAWMAKIGALSLGFIAIIKSASFVMALVIVAADLFIRRRRLLAWC